MTYALVNAARSQIIKVGPRPRWLMPDRNVVSDAVLAAGGFAVDEHGEIIVDGKGKPILATDRDGWLPVVQAEIIGADDLLNTLAWNETADWIIEQDRVIQTYTITPRPLVVIKSMVASQIDSMADGARGNFVTQGGPGQALEYDETRREIDAWNAATDPDINDYPMLRAEYRARRIAEPDITAEQVVADSQAEVEIWRVSGSAIKEIRRTAKVAVEVAETPERVRQIVDWATGAFQSAALTGAFGAIL